VDAPGGEGCRRCATRSRRCIAPSRSPRALAGRARLAYEELLFVHILHRRARQLAAAGARRDHVREQARAHDAGSARRCRSSSPRRRCAACARSSPTCAATAKMHRLLQGDVGAGKTVVAVFAALLAMENGYQVALMAPTELLAEQHARTLDKLLAPLGIVPVLVTGSRSAKERKLAATRLESGEPLIAVGTHAFVAEGTKFAKLGSRDHRRAAPLRCGPAARADGGARGEGEAGCVPHVRDAHPAFARADDVRRPRRVGARRAPAGSRAGDDGAKAGHGTREGVRVREPADRRRAGRRMWSIRSSRTRRRSRSRRRRQPSRSSPPGALHGRRVALLHGKMPRGREGRGDAAFRDGAWTCSSRRR
jgi:hypothetical protein